MTKDELRTTMTRIGCSNVQLAKWLGVSPVTISYWRTGTHQIPNPAAVAVKALATGWRPSDQEKVK